MEERHDEREELERLIEREFEAYVTLRLENIREENRTLICALTDLRNRIIGAE